MERAMNRTDQQQQSVGGVPPSNGCLNAADERKTGLQGAYIISHMKKMMMTGVLVVEKCNP